MTCSIGEDVGIVCNDVNTCAGFGSKSRPCAESIVRVMLILVTLVRYFFEGQDDKVENEVEEIGEAKQAHYCTFVKPSQEFYQKVLLRQRRCGERSSPRTPRLPLVPIPGTPNQIPCPVDALPV
jgi:hypothetical protein